MKKAWKYLLQRTALLAMLATTLWLKLGKKITEIGESAICSAEEWYDQIIHPEGKLFGNDEPTSAKRHMHGRKTYFADTSNSSQTVAPWTLRYQVVLFGRNDLNCISSATANGGTAGEVILGIAEDSPDLPGDPIVVDIPDAVTGTVIGTANGAITAGTFLESAGNGNVQAWSSGSTNCFIGVSLSTATASGDYIEMTLALNPGSSQTIIASGTSITSTF